MLSSNERFVSRRNSKMRDSDRIRLQRTLGVLGFAVFTAALAFALHRAAPRIEHIDPVWLIPTCLAVLASLAVQMEQIIVFLRSRGLKDSRRWAAWFACEKAWLNVAIPAKAGTVGAIAVMVRRHGLPWTEYLAFLLLCSLLTAAASLGGALFLFLDTKLAIASSIAVGLALIAIPRLPGDQGRGSRFYLLFLAIANLMAISLGLVFALRSLGIAGGFVDLFPAGIALNLLSLASLTPGNFGIREAVLAALSPLLTLTFAQLILAATTFVIARLSLTFLLATVLRNVAWVPAE
jgi:uncharacterized membrane protein YbhN (UPF0104 family)